MAEDKVRVAREELERRLMLYVEQLKGATGHLQEPSRVAKRLLAIMSPKGPRLPPFNWTEEQKSELKVGDLVVAYPGVYPPNYPEDYTVSSIDRRNPNAVAVHLAHAWGQEPTLYVGFDRLDPRTVMQEDPSDCFLFEEDDNPETA